MKLVDLFPEAMMLLELKSRDKKSAIKEMLQHLVDQGKFKDETLKKLEKAVSKREVQGSTGIGKGLAIPHAKGCDFLDGIFGVFARSSQGVPFDSVDGGLVYVLFLVVSSEEEADRHLKIMRKIAMLHRDEKSLRFLASPTRTESIREILKEIDEQLG
jgi:mannitol/fructose-specific phosphotransferase system IIA component (Ntr-type)